MRKFIGKNVKIELQRNWFKRKSLRGKIVAVENNCVILLSDCKRELVPYNSILRIVMKY